MNTSFSENDIVTILDSLSIQYDKSGFKKGWMPILCPFHNDKSLGSCFINNSSVIKCHSCGASSNLFSIIKIRNPSLTNKEVFERLGSKTFNRLNQILEKRSIKESTMVKQLYSFDYSSLKTKEVNIDLYYCKSRNFTVDFINKYNIKVITDGYYKDYFIIPIMWDNNSYSWEFRKAYEYEYLKDILKVRGSLEELRSKFKNEERYYDESDPKVKYLKKPKVLYPSGNDISNIIFDFNNLNREEDLYICEGIAGIPGVGKSNVTALFGSNPSKKQLDLLKRFKKKKILISDGDEAGDKLIGILTQKIQDFYIFPGFQTGANYLIEKSQLFYGIKIA